MSQEPFEGFRFRGVAITLLTVAVLGFGVSTVLALSRTQPFYAWYYQFAWYTTLVALAAALALRRGRFPLLGQPRFGLSLLGWSVPAWLVFEAVNLRIANWYYVFAASALPVRRAGTVLAFATVFPAIFLAYGWWTESGVGERWRGPRFRVTRSVRTALLALGVAFIGLSMWAPRFFFPLVWGAVTLLLEPWNYTRRPETSLLGDLGRGWYTRIIRLVLAGATVGLLWELFNSVAQTRWIYTVPGLEGLKLFEMPVLGYLGFPVFALDCFVIYQSLVNLRVAADGWLDAGSGAVATPERSARRDTVEGAPERAPGSGVIRGRILALVAVAAVFATGVAAGMDRWTVDSTYPQLADLPGADSAEIDALKRAGFGHVHQLAALTPDALSRAAALERAAAERLLETSRLVLMRGLGTTNAAALRSAGIDTRCDLAAASEDGVSRAIRRYREDPRAGHPPRVRVWLRAARGACSRVNAPSVGNEE